MPTSADVLSWSTLTPAVNEMKSPNSFVKNLLFSREVTVPTRHIELSFLDRGRKIAPFVQRNGAAIMTTGRDESFRVIMPPHIRVKRPMTPSELLEKRRPGSVIFPGAQGMQRAMREYMASELSMLGDDISNSEEFLACLALRGAVSYSSKDEASFSITFPRASNQDYALGSGDRWNESTSKKRKDFLDAAQLVSDAVSLNVTDVILGTEAADAFLEDASGELSTLLDLRRMSTGTIDLTQQIAESGALFLGTFVHGIRVWRYGRQVDVNGVATDLIRPKYAEFVAATPSAQFVTYYGAIEDMKAIGAGKVMQSKRFSKSWEEEDPSARMLLIESNPMCVPRRPNAMVSVQVLA
jgi:hypothetical protein